MARADRSSLERALDLDTETVGKSPARVIEGSASRGAWYFLLLYRRRRVVAIDDKA
jgi:hypothetical protein